MYFHPVVFSSDVVYGWGENESGELVITPITHTCQGTPMQIRKGYKHTLLLNCDHSLLCFGHNTSGELGVGHKSDLTAPTRNDALPGEVVRVDCGSDYSLVLLRDGSLYSCGNNETGQLGIGIADNQCTPVRVASLPGWVIQTSCGGGFSVALTKEGLLYSWGFNPFGELGIGCQGGNRSTPERVLGMEDVREVSCGGYHVLALTREGHLFSWGNNQFGQLGIGNEVNQNVPIRVVGISTRIRSIRCGANHSMALLRDGSLYSWGNNSSGQLGIGNTNNQLIPTKVNSISDIIQISCGSFSSMAITSSYELYCWGDSEYDLKGPVKTIVFEVLPRRIFVSQNPNKRELFFEREFVDVIAEWPQSHSFFSKPIQKSTEELLSILKTNNIPKDISIHLLKILLHLYYQPPL